jgi:hypothetical protein
MAPEARRRNQSHPPDLERTLMVTWSEFADAAPEFAAAGLERFMRSEIILLGSIRKDGSPRISPVEADVVDGELMAGMMWQSKKALDLLRDSRCTVHSTVHDRMDAMGEFKLRCRASDIQDPHKRDRYGEVIYARIKWRPEGDFHLFAFDIKSAAHLHYGDQKKHVTVWTPGRGLTSRVEDSP